MGNTLLTPTIIANELLMRFKNNLPFASGASHEYDEKFQKIGDTYNLRQPVQFVANDGADITSAIQDVKEYSTPLVINKQKNVAFSFTSKDLTLTIDRFADRYLNSAAVSLGNQFDVDGLTEAMTAATGVVGTPGTTPATAQVVLDAGAMLDNNSCPVDGERSLVVNPATQASMVNALKGLFQDSTQIRNQYTRGKMGTALGFEWAMSQNVRTLTCGTRGTLIEVKGGSQTGATLACDGATATTGTVKAGEKFTLENVNAVNRVTGDDLGYLQEFTVLADATADGSGNISLSISPSIVTTGAGKTVSAGPADNADLVWLTGAASAKHPMNIAYHKHAFAYAMAKLEVPQGVHFAKTAVDEDSGMSIRIVSQYNVLTDIFVTRCDIMYGWVARRPEWAVALIG